MAAGRITLQTDVDCESVSGHCDVTLSNRGDESAFELTLEALARAPRRVDGPGELRPGEEWRTSVDVSDAGPAPGGRSAVALVVHYHDAGGYPLSAVSYGYLTDADFTGTGFAAALSSVSLGEQPVEVVVAIESTPAPIDLSVRLLLPDELRRAVGPPVRAVRTATDSRVEVEFSVENATALPDGAYEILALVRADAPGSRRDLVVPATVTIPGPSTPLGRAWPILAVLATGLLAYGVVRNLPPGRRAPVAERMSDRHSLVLDLLVLGALVAYVVLLLQPGHLLSPTIATGGDTGSHYLTAEVVVETLLPAWRLLSWMPGNLTGYPIFQLYFPLPFLLMAAVSPLVGLPVAFKLVTAVGALLLPPAAYISLRCFGFRRPIPILGAASTLPFLLNETNSVWGANLLSTLAGEFAYSLAFSLLVLFVGTSYRGLVQRRHLVFNALLLAAIGLCHAYGLLLAGAASAAHLLWLPRTRDNAWYLVRVYGLTFATIGFWLLPLLAYAPFTTPYRDLWQIESWQAVVPPILWPWAGVFLTALLWTAVRRWIRGQAGGVSTSHFALGNLLWIGLGFYSLAPLLGVVDVRFLPVVQLATCLLAAVVVGSLVRRLRGRLALTAAVILGLLVWSDSRVHAIPRWAAWNYSGFEAKPLWGAFERLNRSLAGGPNDPRVAFEHSPFHNAVGTIRAFESLPLFSGRSTLEGLYIQSGIASPEIFYLQSEYSAVASCPFPDYHCARLDLGRAAEHMRLFNAGQLIARSATVKAALAASPDFELEQTVAPFEIHRLREHRGSYVEALELQPVVLESADWKVDFFRWFKQQGGQPLLLRGSGHTIDADRFPLRVEDLSEPLPQMTLPRAEEVVASAAIEPARIRIHTNQVGHPLLVKVAYHPRWRPTRGARAVHLASPGLMLVYPEERDVVLEFGPTWVTRLAQVLSLAGLAGVVAAAIAGRRRRFSRQDSVLDADRVRRSRAIAATLVVAVLLLAAAGSRCAGNGDAGVLYRRGLEAYKAERNDEAEALFRRAAAANPLSSAALHASFYRGLALWRQDRWSDTVAALESMIETFPESPYRAEAEYHIGLAYLRLADEDRARRAFEVLVDAFPGDDWASRAAQRLAEVASEEPGDSSSPSNRVR